MKTLEQVKGFLSSCNLGMNSLVMYLSHFEDGEYKDYLLAVRKISQDEDDYRKFYYTAGKNFNIAVAAPMISEFMYGVFEEEITPEAADYVLDFLDKAVKVFDNYLELLGEYDNAI